MENSSGDHGFTGANWPCVHANLGTTSDFGEAMTANSSSTSPAMLTPRLLTLDTNTNIGNSNHETSSHRPDFYNYRDSWTTDSCTEEHFQEGGDFYLDRRLDNVSHEAVFDVTEDIDRNIDDFLDFEDELMEEDCTSMERMKNYKYQDVLSDDEFTGPQYSWYLRPYAEDFVNDIKFLEDFWRPDRPVLRWAMVDDWNQKLEDNWVNSLLGRNVDYKSIIKSEEQMNDEEVEDHETLLLIMDTIKVPKQLNEGVRMLYEFHSCKPDLDLRPYLQDLDYYLKRFVIWGVNYYYNVDAKNKMNDASSSAEEETEHDSKMKKLSCQMLQSEQKMNKVLNMYWNILLEWFVDHYFTNLIKTDSNTQNFKI